MYLEFTPICPNDFGKIMVNAAKNKTKQKIKMVRAGSCAALLYTGMRVPRVGRELCVDLASRATTLRPPGLGGYFLVLLEIERWGQGRLRGTLGCVS